MRHWEQNKSWINGWVNHGHKPDWGALFHCKRCLIRILWLKLIGGKQQ